MVRITIGSIASWWPSSSRGCRGSVAVVCFCVRQRGCLRTDIPRQCPQLVLIQISRCVGNRPWRYPKLAKLIAQFLVAHLSTSHGCKYLLNHRWLNQHFLNSTLVATPPILFTWYARLREKFKVHLIKGAALRCMVECKSFIVESASSLCCLFSATVVVIIPEPLAFYSFSPMVRGPSSTTATCDLGPTHYEP